MPECDPFFVVDIGGWICLNIKEEWTMEQASGKCREKELFIQSKCAEKSFYVYY